MKDKMTDIEQLQLQLQALRPKLVMMEPRKPEGKPKLQVATGECVAVFMDDYINTIAKNIGIMGCEVQALIESLATSNDPVGMEMFKDLFFYGKMGFAGSEIANQQETLKKRNESYQWHYQDDLANYEREMAQYHEKMKLYQSWLSMGEKIDKDDLACIASQIRTIISKIDRNQPNPVQYAFLYYLKRSKNKNPPPDSQKNWYFLCDWIENVDLETYLREVSKSRPESFLAIVHNVKHGGIPNDSWSEKPENDDTTEA